MKKSQWTAQWNDFAGVYERHTTGKLRYKLWVFDPRERENNVSLHLSMNSAAGRGWVLLVITMNRWGKNFFLSFYFDLQLKKICLFYFRFKNDEAASTCVSPQSCWFSPVFSPSLPFFLPSTPQHLNLFQTMSVQIPSLVGTVCCQGPSGAFSAVYFLNYKLQVVLCVRVVGKEGGDCMPSSKFTTWKVWICF